MVREKRPAEKAAVGHSKRQKILSTSSHHSSPVRNDREDDTGSYVLPDGNPEDEERLTQEIQSKLDKLKADHVKRNKSSKDFQEKIKRKQGELSWTIVTAKDKTGERREGFKSQMLPILDAALKDLTLRPDTTSRERSSLNVESKAELAALQDANEALSSCSELITCYQKVTSISPIAPSTSRTRTIFESDRDETMRAFESAKKMTINQLQAGLADKMDDSRDRFDLDDREFHVARKILVRGKGSSPVRNSTSIGPLLYEFGKIVGKMQSMVDR